MHQTATDRVAHRFTPCCRPAPRGRAADRPEDAAARDLAARTVQQHRLMYVLKELLRRMDSDLGALALYVEEHPAEMNAALAEGRPIKSRLATLAKLMNVIDADLARCRPRPEDARLSAEQRRVTAVVRGCELTEGVVATIIGEFYPLFFAIASAAHNQVAGFDIEWYRERRRRLSEEIAGSRLEEGLSEDWLQWFGRIGIQKVRRAAVAGMQSLHQMGAVIHRNRTVFLQQALQHARALSIGWLMSLCIPGTWQAMAWEMLRPSYMAGGGAAAAIVTGAERVLRRSRGVFAMLQSTMLAIRSTSTILQALVRLLLRLMGQSVDGQQMLIDRLKSKALAMQLRKMFPAASPYAGQAPGAELAASASASVLARHGALVVKALKTLLLPWQDVVVDNEEDKRTLMTYMFMGVQTTLAAGLLMNPTTPIGAIAAMSGVLGMINHKATNMRVVPPAADRGLFIGNAIPRGEPLQIGHTPPDLGVVPGTPSIPQSVVPGTPRAATAVSSAAQPDPMPLHWWWSSDAPPTLPTPPVPQRHRRIDPRDASVVPGAPFAAPPQGMTIVESVLNQFKAVNPFRTPASIVESTEQCAEAVRREAGSTPQVRPSSAAVTVYTPDRSPAPPRRKSTSTALAVYTPGRSPAPARRKSTSTAVTVYTPDRSPAPPRRKPTSAAATQHTGRASTSSAGPPATSRETAATKAASNAAALDDSLSTHVATLLAWAPVLAAIAEMIEQQPDTSVRVQLDKIDREYRRPPAPSKLLAGDPLLPRPDPDSVYEQCRANGVVSEPRCAAEALAVSGAMPRRRRSRRR